MAGDKYYKLLITVSKYAAVFVTSHLLLFRLALALQLTSSHWNALATSFSFFAKASLHNVREYPDFLRSSPKGEGFLVFDNTTLLVEKFCHRIIEAWRVLLSNITIKCNQSQSQINAQWAIFGEFFEFSEKKLNFQSIFVYLLYLLISGSILYIKNTSNFV